MKRIQLIIARVMERILGYVPAGRWRLYPLEEAHRLRYSMPARVPIPEEEWREWPPGYRPEKLSHARIAGHAARFAQEHPRHWAAMELRRFADKAPLAEKVEDALRHKEWEQAAAMLREVLVQDPDDGRAHFLLALAMLGRQKPEEATVHLAQAAFTMAGDPDYHFAVGRMHEQQGDLEAAREHYRKALEIERGHPGALERLAAHGEMVEIYLGNLDQPQKAYLTAEDYEDVIVRGWKESQHDTAFFVDRSHFHLMSGQPSLARKAADFALACAACKEDEVAALEARCRASLAAGSNAEAGAAAARLEEIAPGEAAALSCRGQWLWFEGKHDEAAPLILKALQLEPNRVENIRIYLEPDFPKAVRDPLAAARNLLKEHPQSWAVRFVTASLLMAKGEWDESLGHAYEAAAHGASEDALLELTGRLGRANRFEEAGKLIDRAGGWKRYRQSNPLLRANIATALERSGRVSEACDLWRGILNDDHAHPDLRLRARDALRRCLPEGEAHPPVH